MKNNKEIDYKQYNICIKYILARLKYLPIMLVFC